MGWKLGSESVDESGAGALPSGLCHAVDPSGELTACGRPVRSLRRWDDIPSRRARMVGVDVCEACEADTD